MSAKKVISEAEAARMDARFYQPVPGPNDRPLIPLHGFSFELRRTGPMSKALTAFPSFSGIFYDVTRIDAAGSPIVERKFINRFYLLYSVGFPADGQVQRVASFLKFIYSDPETQDSAKKDHGATCPSVIDIQNSPKGRYYSVMNLTLRRMLLDKYGVEFRNPESVKSVYLDVVTSNTHAAVIAFPKTHPLLPNTLSLTDGAYDPKVFVLPREIKPTPKVGFEESVGLHCAALHNSGNKCWWIHLIPAVMFLMHSPSTGLLWGNLHEYFGDGEVSEQQAWQCLQREFDSKILLSEVQMKKFKRRFKVVYLMCLLEKSLTNRPGFEYLSLDPIMIEVFRCISDMMDIGDGSTQQDGSEWILKFSQILSETKETLLQFIPALHHRGWQPIVSSITRRAIFTCPHCTIQRAQDDNVVFSTLTIDVLFQDYLDDPNKTIDPVEKLNESSVSDTISIDPCSTCDRYGNVTSNYTIVSASDNIIITFNRRAGILPSGRSCVAQNPVSTGLLKLKVGGRRKRYAYYSPRVIGLGFVSAYESAEVIGSGNYDVFGHWRSLVRKGDLALIDDDEINFVPVCHWDEVSAMFGRNISVICYKKLTDQEVEALGFDPNETPPFENSDSL